MINFFDITVKFFAAIIKFFHICSKCLKSIFFFTTLIFITLSSTYD